MKKTIVPVLAVFFILGWSCTQDSERVFNGKDLSNWNFVVENDAVPGNQVYTVKDGQISIKGEPLGYMYSKEKYRNFTLELEYKWAAEESNSGIFVLIEDPKNPFPNGIEIQLAAGKAGDFVLLGGSDMVEYSLPEGVTERPKFPVVEKNQASSELPAGEWNKVRITVKDSVVDVYVNGVHQNTGTGTVSEGHIGLQSEGTEILFRNLTFTKL
ncbi:MAG: DUF1080 domain-containing protein [Bacteroidia bacterium]|nr:DUF1080 domain-containing protein [Bacteroidia bacterium]